MAKIDVIWNSIQQQVAAVYALTRGSSYIILMWKSFKIESVYINAHKVDDCCYLCTSCEECLTMENTHICECGKSFGKWLQMNQMSEKIEASWRPHTWSKVK